jgi:hypothetical protein
VAAFSYTDVVSLLARDLAERVATLCPHVPAGELAELTSRLALAEHAHASGVSFDDHEANMAAAPLGNRIVWLPGPAASAIILPAGEETSGAGATVARVVEWVRPRVALARGVAAGALNSLRQIGSALSAPVRRARAFNR